MSHFVGLVIVTPGYDGSLEESLEKYNEAKEVEPYVNGKVTWTDKLAVIEHYSMTVKEKEEFYEGIINYLKEIKGKDFYTFEKFLAESPKWLLKESEEEQKKRWLRYTLFNKEKYAAETEDYILNKTDIFSRFEEVYSKYGDKWNGNNYKPNSEGVWEEWTTYNPDSKWDWYVYDNYSRWDGYLLTKTGEYTNRCLLSDIDLSVPNNKDDKFNHWHLSDDYLPFCVVIDGEWKEKAKMGYWAVTWDEKPQDEWENEVKELLSSLPADSEVTAVDFHI